MNPPRAGGSALVFVVVASSEVASAADDRLPFGGASEAWHSLVRE